MKKQVFKYLFLLCFTIFISSCDKDNSNLCASFFDMEEDKIQSKVDKLCRGLKPNSTDADPLGHQDNIDELIERLNEIDCITASSDYCYGCILTLPVQTEITITVEQDGASKTMVLDITTPEKERLSFAGVHE